MPQLWIVLAVLALVGAACSDDEPDNAAESTTTTTAAEPTGPGTFCEGFATISRSLDEITSAMVSTMNGEEPAAFIVVLGDAVDVMAATAPLAPDAELAEQANLVASTYEGFEELLFETDFDVAAIPVDDPRAAALTDPALAEAIGAMNEHCV